MIRSLIILLLLSSTSLGSNLHLKLALEDSKKDIFNAPFTRYLSAYHCTDKQIEELDKGLGFWCNSLSTEVSIKKPVQIHSGLWKIDLRDYNWKTETWEKLLEAPEPYFHIRGLVSVTEVEQLAFDENGKLVVISKKENTKFKEQAAHAFWLNQLDINLLASYTKSGIPLVRADWFIYQTAIQKDRKAGYYDFLGLGKKEKDFQNLIAADIEAVKKLRLEQRAIVSSSSVTLHNRTLRRLKTITGPYWISEDYNANTENKNAIRLLDDAKFDATEQYGTLPNGLFAFWLGNAQGERQDTAPDFIASDSESPTTDKRVHVGLSCIRCHTEGIRPINDVIRKIYKPPFKLTSLDYERQKDLQAKFLSDIGSSIEKDQKYYNEVLSQTNNLNSLDNSKLFARIYSRYSGTRNLEQASKELETSSDFLTTKLKQGTTKQPLDPILILLLQGESVTIEQWEEIFPQAMKFLKE